MNFNTQHTPPLSILALQTCSLNLSSFIVCLSWLVLTRQPPRRTIFFAVFWSNGTLLWWGSYLWCWIILIAFINYFGWLLFKYCNYFLYQLDFRVNFLYCTNYCSQALLHLSCKHFFLCWISLRKFIHCSDFCALLRIFTQLGPYSSFHMGFQA